MNVRIIRKRPAAACMVAVACVTLPPLAHADLDPFAVSVGETVSHDSNVFRSVAGSPDSQSDTRLRLDFSDTLGRSKAMAWAAGDVNRYKRNTQLDNDGHLLGGEFDWATLYELSGKIGADDDSSLYRSGLGGEQSYEGKSIIHTQTAFTRVALGSTTPFGIDGGVVFTSAKNSAPVLAVNNLSQWVGDIGVSYMQSPDLRISLIGRRTTGKYANFLPTAIDLQRNDLVLGTNWTTSGFTNVEAQVAHTQEDYSISSGRHYWTGFVRGNWQVTGHITLSASLARDSTQNFQGGVLGQASNGDSPGGATGGSGTTGSTGSTSPQPVITQQSLSMNDAVELSGKWQFTSKIDLSGSWLHATRHYDHVMLGNIPLNGSDASSQYQAGINYQWTRSVRAGCSGSRATHVAGDLLALGNGYVSNAYSCFAELSLQ